MFLTSPNPTLLSADANRGASRSTDPQDRRQAGRQEKSRRLPATLGLLVIFCMLCVAVPAFSQANNTINTVAGGGPVPSAPLQADLAGPSSVAEDSSGNIYIAATNSYYVYEWNKSAKTLSVFAGVGIQGGGGDGNVATKAQLLGPAAVAVDGSNNVYIADGNKIRCVAAVNGACGGVAPGQINTIAGVRGQCSPAWNTCGDGGPAADAMLGIPTALFVDPSGNIYIADTQDMRIREITTDGNINTVAGTGHTCTGPHFTCGDGGLATAAQLDLPQGVVVDGSGNIYIGDTRDERIRYVQKSTGNISTIIGSGSYCVDPTSSCGDGGALLSAKFHNPAAVILDGAGNLYIADSLDYKIRKVTPGANGQISTIAGSGVQGFSGDGGAPLSADLNVPLTVVMDSSGTFTIADFGSQRVRQFTINKVINTIAGGGTGGDGGVPTNATLANSVTVAWDTTGTNYYIADAANNRVREVSNGAVNTIAGTGELGFSGDNGQAGAATLNSPTGLAIDGSGNVYVGDAGNLRVRMINAGSGVITTVAGSGNSCFPKTGACGDGGPATSANLTTPYSVSLDGKGNLYIADYYTCRVRKVNSSGTISTLAGTGVCGFTGDNGPATSAKLNYPYGVASDAAGNVYIADSKNNRIRCVVGATGGCGGSKAAVGTIITYAFNGFATFKGDGGPALQAAMQDPLEVSLDPSGNLFVGGGADQVVRRIDGVNQTVTTVAGDPQYPTSGGFGGDGGPALQATLDNLGSSVNAAQQLLIADTGNNRIRQVDMVPVVTKSYAVSFGNETVGQTSPPKPDTLKNTGLAALPITGVQITGANAKDFAVSSNACGTEVAPGISCKVNVTFTPHAKGARVAALKVNTSAGTLSTKLTGTGQ